MELGPATSLSTHEVLKCVRKSISLIPSTSINQLLLVHPVLPQVINIHVYYDSSKTHAFFHLLE